MMRFTAVFYLLLASTSPVAAQSPIDTLYFLPKTVVTISGTVSSKNNFTKDGLVRISEPGPATITTGVVADPSAYYYYRTDSKLLSKNSFTLELSEGGIISGVNSVSESQLGSILRNIVGIVTGLAKIGAGVAFAASSPAEDLYRGDFPELAKRRVMLKTAIDTMLDKMIALQRKLVDEADPKRRAALRDDIADVQKALSTLRVEADGSDAHFAAWKARAEDAQQQSYQWIIDSDDLLPQAAIPGKQLSELEKLASTQMRDVIQKLRVIVSLELPPLPTSASPQLGGHSDLLYHRVVTPSIIRLYRIRPNDSLELVTHTALPVFSKTSTVSALPSPDAKWSKRTLTATFADGALTKVSAETSSELAAATEALRGLPGDYLSSLKQANEVAAEQRTLSLQSIDNRIEQLKKQKELAEAALAQRQIVSVGSAKSTIVELETQIKLLETQRAFSDAQGSAADRNAVRLENEMAKLQLEQAELRRKLDALERERQ